MRICIIADNQFITSEGISALLKKAGIETTVKVTTVQELQKQLNLYPDAVIILDYTLFDFSSPQQLLEMKAAAAQSSWVLFPDQLDETFLRILLSSDPSISVVTKYESEKTIEEAFDCAGNDTPYLCERARQMLTNDVPSNTNTDNGNLTASEKIVLREIAKGKTTKEIAYEKNVSFHTVNSHRKNIFRKLQVNSLQDATKYAIRTGIFDVTEYYI